MLNRGCLVLAATALVSAFVCAYADNLTSQPVILQGQTILAIGIAIIGIPAGFALLLRAEKRKP